MTEFPSLFYYKAFVDSVYDGDTITCTIDCGFNLSMKKQKIRLSGIDTPEIRGEEREQAIIVRDKLRNKILGKEVILKTDKDKTGKYGRYLATVYINGENVNEWLVKEGHAAIY